MSKLRHNNDALIEVTFATLGLFIAAAILIAAVVSAVFTNDWQREAELDSIARGFVYYVEAMDARSYKNISTYQFPDKGYSYSAEISTEYITMRAQGFWGNELVVTKQFIVQPWVQDQTSSWIGGEQLHSFINDISGTYGNHSDPVLPQYEQIIKENLTIKETDDAKQHALDPMIIYEDTILTVEKEFVYFDYPEDLIFFFWGDECTHRGGDTDINQNEHLVILSPSFLVVDDGWAWFNITLPSAYNPLFIDVKIKTYYKESGWDFVDGWGDGPQLAIENTKYGGMEVLVDDLGDTGDYKWRNTSVLEPYKYLENALNVRYHTDGDGALDHTSIKKVIIQLSLSEDIPMETESFLFVYL